MPLLDQKQNLIDLTKRSLADEYEIAAIDHDYSYASTSWLPIKSYYLIFNVLLTIEYIFRLRKNVFKYSHAACVDAFTKKLEQNLISFSEPILNQVFDKTLLTLKTDSGANLSSKTNLPDMFEMVIRKIAKYKDEDWKSKNKIDLRKSAHREKHQKYLNSSFRVSIFDFAYFMRIRANYRDFAFIEGISSSETFEYFGKYYGFTLNLIGALDSLKTKLIAVRKR
ncbi:MAG: hypothetical protein IIA17_10945 [candidate division Zixibacteria bacterium]|nr:hypothetical protein [candidate division Zixibacteria bacterium]